MSRTKDTTEKSERSQRPPRTTVAVGGVFILNGVTYRVVRRTGVVYPREACMGCAFKGSNCPEGIACSAFDRRDRTFVWFVER